MTPGQIAFEQWREQWRDVAYTWDELPATARRTWAEREAQQPAAYVITAGKVSDAALAKLLEQFRAEYSTCRIRVALPPEREAAEQPTCCGMGDCGRNCTR